MLNNEQYNKLKKLLKSFRISIMNSELPGDEGDFHNRNSELIENEILQLFKQVNKE